MHLSKCNFGIRIKEHSPMTNQNRAYLLAIVSIAFWCTMGTAFKLTLRFINPPLLLFYTSLVAFVFLVTVSVFTRRFVLLKDVSVKDILNSALMGFFNPFLYYMVLFKAYSLIKAQEAVALNYLWPVMLVVFSIIFLKQKISPAGILALLISFIGVLVIATQGNLTGFTFSNPLGVCLAAGSSIVWASFWILNMKDKREDVTKMLLNFLFGFLYIAGWNLLTGNLKIPALPAVAGAMYIGIFEMGLTFVLWITALNLSSNTARISNLVFISPFLSLVLVSIFVGEKIMVTTVLGLILIVGGILLQVYVKESKTT